MTVYSKDFGTRGVRIRTSRGVRHCMSCGNVIAKGEKYLGSTGMQYTNTCSNCCGQAYLNLTGGEVEIDLQQIAVKKKLHEKTMEQEDLLFFEDRLKSLLKNYSSDRIIKYILLQIRK